MLIRDNPYEARLKSKCSGARTHAAIIEVKDILTVSFVSIMGASSQYLEDCTAMIYGFISNAKNHVLKSACKHSKLPGHTRCSKKFLRSVRSKRLLKNRCEVHLPEYALRENGGIRGGIVYSHQVLI